MKNIVSTKTQWIRKLPVFASVTSFAPFYECIINLNKVSRSFKILQSSNISGNAKSTDDT